MTHSPLPWRIDGSGILDANGDCITAEFIDPKGVSDDYYVAPEPDDQALIVRAVNAHAALVSALEEMERRCDINPTADYHLRAQAALKLARGDV